MASKALIIAAAGSGSRMKSDTPKPFLEFDGKTILAHTVQKFLAIEGLKQIIIAAPQEFVARVNAILELLVPESISNQCIAGGASRQASIYKALNHVQDVDLVLIHDAVRPFVKSENIIECCEVASRSGAAVPGIRAKDTIKRVDETGAVEETLNRNNLWQVQTPQVFKKDIIVEAHETARKEKFNGTDDASLVEWLGKKVTMVEGNQSNIKLTYPWDLKLAEFIFKNDE